MHGHLNSLNSHHARPRCRAYALVAAGAENSSSIDAIYFRGDPNKASGIR
jgi:hypothetical protein